ncbi:MAG: hypothetical protein ACRCS9_04410 [Hyphomicrobium sp.]
MNAIGRIGATRQAPALRDEQAYRAALHRHLAGDATKEIEFFVNPHRFDLMLGLIGGHLARRPLSILNVASGPFALEFYCPIAGAECHAFDVSERLAGLHRDLVRDRLIAPATFTVGDVASFKPDRQFDVVIVNDLFYTRALDFFDLIGPLAAAVKPNGLLYFDIQDERAGPIWRMLGKDGAFRRYDLAVVRATLAALGFEVAEPVPSFGIKGGLDHRARTALWRVTGIANNFAFVARRVRG